MEKLIKNAVLGKEQDYKKFRWFITSGRKLVIAGKNAEQNELIVEQTGLNENLLHTSKPGSPFVNIKGRATQENIKQAAIFCAKYSQDWRDNKSEVEVHHFRGKDIYKTKTMAIGTFGVKRFKIIKIKKQEIEKFGVEKCN